MTITDRIRKRFGPLDAAWLRRWTRRLGIAAFITLAFPVVTIILLISIVGMPFGFALLVTPLLFTIVAVANLVQRLIGRDGALAVVASLLLAVAALAGVARYCNALLDRRGDEWLAGDVDELEKPLRAGSIGLARRDFHVWSKGQTKCDELCQRLLLSGAAATVLVPDTKPDVHEWSPSTPAIAFHFEERDSCPTVQLVGRTSSMKPVDDAKPDEAMRLAIASGRCLIEEPTTMAEAEAVVTTGRTHYGRREVDGGLALTADTVSVDRASVHLREHGEFVERYRWTGLTVLLHPIVPVPTLIGGAELNMYPGFARLQQRRNARDFATSDGMDAIRFLRDVLGLDVSVPDSAAPRAALIEKGLDAAGPLPDASRQVIEDLFASFFLSKPIDEATRLLAFRALADPRVPAPRYTWSLVKACAKSGDAVNVELGDILFRKLMQTDPTERENHPSYLGYPAAYLATAIAMLPPVAVQSHRRELEEVARDPGRRWRAHQALDQLALFGADAVPTLLDLVDSSLARKVESKSVKSGNRDEWQPVFRAGLSGLCRLGTTSSAALQPLLARLRDGSLPTDGSTADLLLATLVRIGADPEELRPHFAKDRSKTAMDRFDRDVVRARSDSRCNH